MGFSFEEFPNSDMYDSDLREILLYVRKVKAVLDGYDAVIDELQTDLENIQDLYGRVDALEAATADLDTIRTQILNIKLSIVDLTTEDAFLQEQIAQLSLNLDNIDNKFNEVYAYINTSIASVNVKWYYKWLQLQNIINTRYEELNAKIVDLNNLVLYLMSHLSVNVFNPIAHKRMSFDDNNKQVYVDLRDSGMTYGELGARKFTYGYIRDGHWRHRLFSTKGRRYITHGDTNLYSSISGRWTNWTEALSHAISFIFGTIKYKELAEQEITYGQMASLTYADLIRVSNRERLDYEDLQNLTVNGTNIVCF